MHKVVNGRIRQFWENDDDAYSRDPPRCRRGDTVRATTEVLSVRNQIAPDGQASSNYCHGPFKRTALESPNAGRTAFRSRRPAPQTRRASSCARPCFVPAT